MWTQLKHGLEYAAGAILFFVVAYAVLFGSVFAFALALKALFK